MTVNQKKFPPCFGILENVFPTAGEGLRQTPESCMPCSYKTDCLRKAMADRGGVVVRQEMIDRAYAAGTVGFFERWSRKKALCTQKRRQGKASSTDK